MRVFLNISSSWIYNRDMNHLYSDNHLAYSPLNKQAMAELRRQVHDKIDYNDIEKKILEAKQIETLGGFPKLSSNK